MRKRMDFRTSRFSILIRTQLLLLLMLLMKKLQLIILLQKLMLMMMLLLLSHDSTRNTSCVQTVHAVTDVP